LLLPDESRESKYVFPKTEVKNTLSSDLILSDVVGLFAQNTCTSGTPDDYISNLLQRIEGGNSFVYCNRDPLPPVVGKIFTIVCIIVPNAHTHVYTHSLTHAHIHARTHTYTQARIHTLTQAHVIGVCMTIMLFLPPEILRVVAPLAADSDATYGRSIHLSQYFQHILSGNCSNTAMTFRKQPELSPPGLVSRTCPEVNQCACSSSLQMSHTCFK
jgi:hypothetical protein